MAKCKHNFKKIDNGSSNLYQVYECKKCQKRTFKPKF